MTSSLRYTKIFFTLLMLLAFDHQAFASITVNFNESATEAQKSCVFDVSLDYILNSNYDPDSAEIDIESKDAIFKKTIPASSDGTYLTASTTVLGALPQTSNTFEFQSRLFMSTTSNPGQRVAVGPIEYGDATCINPEYAKTQTVLNKSQTQKTNTFFSATPQNGGSTIQYGNKSFNIGGIGSALSGCLGVGQSINNKLGSLFGSASSTSVEVDDPKLNKKESCGDSLAYAASRIVIQNIAKQAVNWATTGNNGNPYYPTDYRSLYSNIKSDQVKTFISQLQASETLNPYSGSFAKSLATQARSDNQSFTEKYKYTGPGDGFFKEKSGFNWSDWYKYLQPQNNSLGYSQIATRQINNLQNEAAQTTQEELANNNGFLSQKVCDDKNFTAWANDAEQSKNLAAAARGDKAAMTRVDQSVCKNFKIATPGSIIATQLQQALGTPLRQAEQVDEVDESLGMVFDQMVAKLVTKGLSNLSSTDFKNNVDFSYNAPTQNPGYELPTGGGFWDEYNTTFDLRRDLPGIIKTQKAYVAQVRKNNDILGQVLQSIDRMDKSLPGPHIGWAEGVSQKIVETASDLKREAQLQMGGILGNLSTLGMRDKILEGLENLFVKVFNAVFAFYQQAIGNKFDPNINARMPANSTTMIGLIGGRQTYQDIYTQNAEQITTMDDIIFQLEDINKKVEALYTKACTRFIKENPGAKCLP